MSIYIPIYLSIYQSTCLSSLFIQMVEVQRQWVWFETLFIHLSIFLCIYPFIHPPFYLSRWVNPIYPYLQMVEVQRQWVWLETLFIGSEEVKGELPEPTYRFAVVDKLFRMTAAEMYEKRNAVAACSVLGLRERLAMIEEGLQVCDHRIQNRAEVGVRVNPW